MARKEARVHVTIWQDADFVALSAEDQRTYLMAFSQPGISLCGVLPLTLARWARMASDTDADALRASIGRLERARFVVADYDTEELLIRTFICHDGVWRNEKTQAGAKAQRRHIVSRKVLHALDAEIHRLEEGTYLPGDFPDDALSDGASDDLSPRGSWQVEQSPSPSPSPSPPPLAHVNISNGSREGESKFGAEALDAYLEGLPA
jgi:hypothetical protein